MKSFLISVESLTGRSIAIMLGNTESIINLSDKFPKKIFNHVESFKVISFLEKYVENNLDISLMGLALRNPEMFKQFVFRTSHTMRSHVA